MNLRLCHLKYGIYLYLIYLFICLNGLTSGRPSSQKILARLIYKTTKSDARQNQVKGIRTFQNEDNVYSRASVISTRVFLIALSSYCFCLED